MKRTILQLISLCLLLSATALLCGCMAEQPAGLPNAQPPKNSGAAGDPAAVIDGSRIIYVQDIERALEIEQITYSVNRSHIENAPDYTEADKAELLSGLTPAKTGEAILREKIRNAVIDIEAKRLGYTDLSEEAAMLYDNAMSAMLGADAADSAAQLARDIFESCVRSLDMTFDEYREKIGIPIYEAALARAAVKRNFEKTDNKQAAFGAADYEQYIDGLVKSHSIEYY